MAGYAEGTIELQEHELHIIRVADGSWIGSGSDIFTQAVVAGSFRWPRRVDRLHLLGVIIQVGDIRQLASWLNQDVAAAQRHLDEYWPIAERQTIIPTTMPFRIDAMPGAQIQGRLLVEKGVTPTPPTGHATGP